MKIILRCIVILYSAAACFYVLHSMLTHTGLCGWIIAWQFTHFGIAYDNVTIGGAALLLLAPTWPLLAWTRDKQAPDQPPVAFRPGFGTVLGAAAVPLLLAGLAFGYMQYASSQPKKAERMLSLDAAASWSEADAGPVRLKGTWRGDYRLAVDQIDDANRPHDVSERTTFVPLTPPGWKPAQPVACVVSSTFDGYQDQQTHGFAVLGSGTVPVVLRGELRREAVPPYVRAALQKRDVTLAQPSWLLVRGNDVDTGTRAGELKVFGYPFVLVIGVLLSGAILVGGSFGLLVRKARGR